MIKGGYQIIDLKGIELDDTPVTYDGIYDKMLENVGKVCLVANIDVDADPNFDHYFVQPIISGTTILCTVGNKTLKVNAEDGVSVEDGIVGGGSSGTSDYTDLSNKPSINSITLAGNKTAHDLGLQNELTPGSNVSISEENVISATDTTYSPMTGATASAAGTSGLVPAPAAGDQDKALCGDGTYHTMGGGSSVLAVTLKAWTSASPFPYPGPGTEKNVSFTGSYRDITSVGDPSTANVAYVDVILGVSSSSPSTVVARCRCNLILKSSSSSSYTYHFTGVLMPNENTPTVQGFKTICSGTLTYTVSTQTWSLGGNGILISQVALPGAMTDSGFAPQSSVIDDIISYVVNNSGESSKWTLNTLDYVYVPATVVPGSNATCIFNTVLNFSGISSDTNNVLTIKGNPIPVKISRSGASITLDYQGVVYVDANDVVNSDHQITLGTMILHLEFGGSVSTNTFGSGYIMLKSDVIK